MQTPEPHSITVLPVEDAQGVWRVSSTSGGGECQISLVNAPSQRDYGVQVERCSLSLFASVSAWRPTQGGFELLGRDGRPIIRFRQTGVDAFVSTDGVYRLERAFAS